MYKLDADLISSFLDFSQLSSAPKGRVAVNNKKVDNITRYKIHVSVYSPLNGVHAIMIHAHSKQDSNISRSSEQERRLYRLISLCI